MFGFNYNRPGKGVEKRDPNKPRHLVFFEILFRKLWDLCKVNVLYMVTALPTFVVTLIIMGLFSSPIINALAPSLANMMGISAVDSSNAEFMFQVAMIDLIVRGAFSVLFMTFFGQGPTTAGITYILRSYAREEHVWLISDWWQHTKSNMRQSLVVWLIDLFVVSAMIFAFKFYSELGGVASILAYAMIPIGVAYTMMHFYIYPLMITFSNSIKNTFKNAFILSLQAGPRNLFILGIMLFVHVCIPYYGAMLGWSARSWLIFIALEGLLLIAVSGFAVNFFIYPQLEKYLKTDEQEEKVIEDNNNNSNGGIKNEEE